MVSGRIYVTNDQIVCGSREGTANVLYPQNTYTHPTEKQCNYTYTHPTTKQCNWTPDGVINWVLADTKSVSEYVDGTSGGENHISAIDFQYPSDADLYKIVVNSWSTESSGVTGSGRPTNCEYSIYYALSAQYDSIRGSSNYFKKTLVSFVSEEESDPTVYKHNGSNTSFIVVNQSYKFCYAMIIDYRSKGKLTFNASLYYAKL